ncbi:hypothetical protein AX14_000588 [Amanita brunnescens Koide BX004]|nr:hypothetical protein AX14_000588 [Amanita brunnescens Koide BX004]
MTLLWSSLALPLFQQSTAETAIDHYKKDLRQVTENARELISCVDAVQDSATISQAMSIMRKVLTVERNLDKCQKDIKGISHVSDIEAEDVLGIINVLVPEIEKVLELVREKKNVAEIFDIGLPIIRSIAFTAGRFFMWATHVNVKNPTISLIRSEIKCMHDHAMALANTMEKLAPPKYKEDATRIRARVDAKFQEAIELYSS